MPSANPYSSSHGMPTPSHSRQPALASQATNVANWTLHPAYAEQDAQVRQLFEQVFGHAMSQPQWDWKYEGSPLRGTLLCKSDGEAAAFFGGMARPLVHQGRTYLGVQNGDVMVHPSQRAVFSRRGALYQVASHFFDHHVGPGAEYAFAYGFPSQRHFDLGVKLGLYDSAGRMMELRWAPMAPRRRWGWRCTPLTEAQLPAIDGLWPLMQESWPDRFLPVRDGARWAYRYLRRPEIPYVLLLLRSRWTAKPMAALALRRHPQHVEWLDYVGPARHIGVAVEAARQWAFGQGQLPVTALFSDSIAQQFAIGHEGLALSPICVPVNASEAAAGDRPWLQRLWLMGGDSDFM